MKLITVAAESRIEERGDEFRTRAAQAWVAQCTARLRQLRPALDHLSCRRVSSSLWRDVAGYDPRIAAEMEHESWPIGT